MQTCKIVYVNRFRGIRLCQCVYILAFSYFGDGFRSWDVVHFGDKFRFQRSRRKIRKKKVIIKQRKQRQ